MKKYFLAALTVVFLCGITPAFSQNEDSLIIRNIYSEALTNFEAYNNLKHLCKHYPGRLTSSIQSVNAANWIFNLLEQMNVDNVYTQDLMVRNWVRGEKEYACAYSKSHGKVEFSVCALGVSTGTGEKGIRTGIVEVKSFDELKALGRDNVQGKIVFFNRAADQRGISTGYGYGSSVDQRVRGAIEGAKLGAVGVVVRSATVSLDKFPHTGVMRYVDTLEKIPAIGISTMDADYLSTLIKDEPGLEFYFRTTCHQNPEVPSLNVIGELKGSEKPEEIILIGGHIDSWDLGEGAHDDGAGIIQSIEVLRIFKSLGIKPKHTIRIVAFMDEEIDQKGGRKYAEIVAAKNEKHIAGIEADGGGFTPQGFSIEGTDEQVAAIKKFQPYFEPYLLFRFIKGGSGVDISFLNKMGFPLMGLIVDSQRYFDYHHSANDVFENVNRREMQLGSASIAAMVYLMDKYEIKP
jgi:carboxypeptidase Q